MIKKFYHKVIGTPHQRYIKQLNPIVVEIDSWGEEYANLDDQELANKTLEFRQRLEDGEDLDALLPESFAVCREACDRRLGILNILRPQFAFDFNKLGSEKDVAEQAIESLKTEKEWEVMLPASFYRKVRDLYPDSVRPFRMRSFGVQLIGGVVLNKGNIAEMATGEGKTLAAASPVYLNALSGKGAHVVTVNDYLAERDAEFMGMAYKFLGLSVGTILAKLDPEERQQSYAADITYGTNNEFGFDYLRDNMAVDPEHLVQRELNFCVVDEVDSILVDEARTPLIISGPAEDSTDNYLTINKLIPELKVDQHFLIDEKGHSVLLTDEGVEICEKFLKVDNLYGDLHSKWVHHINQALKAYFLYQNDKEYVLEGGEVVIIDEHTGRKMEGRRYSDGLHQAIEAKEGMKIRRENQTLATITFQNFFRMYNKLSGMTGTAETEAQEFGQIYKLGVTVIPTHRPIVREDHDDLIYRTHDEKINAVVKEIRERHEKGQPILVGTISIEKSEELARRLKKEGIKHAVLNAKQHGKEANVILNAGQMGNVTIATNMAGRGTDIVLGDGVKEVGGLHVLATERHESRRIDNQLRGRSGRQGDPGSSQFYLCLDDDLMRIFGGDRIKSMMDRMGAEEGEVITHGLVNRAVANAQKRVEGQNFESRKHLLEYDDVMNQQRKVIYSLRRRILEGQDIQTEIKHQYEDAIDLKLSRFIPPGTYPEEWDLDNLSKEIKRAYNIEWNMEGKDLHNTRPEDILDEVIDLVNERWDSIDEVVPSKDVRNLERRVLLMTIDQVYKDHLLSMDHLRDSIRFQGYAQKDPLMIYKKEGFKFFEKCLEDISTTTTQRLLNVKIQNTDEEESTKPAPVRAAATPVGALPQGGPQGKIAPQVKAGGPASRQKLGRNDLCWCGSGKKFKKCHGA